MHYKLKAMREYEIFKSKMSKHTAPSVIFIFQSIQFFQSASVFVLWECREVNEAKKTVSSSLNTYSVISNWKLYVFLFSWITGLLVYIVTFNLTIACKFMSDKMKVCQSCAHSDFQWQCIHVRFFCWWLWLFIMLYLR